MTATILSSVDGVALSATAPVDAAASSACAIFALSAPESRFSYVFTELAEDAVEEEIAL
jgi:hypothetical protein